MEFGRLVVRMVSGIEGRETYKCSRGFCRVAGSFSLVGESYGFFRVL